MELRLKGAIISCYNSNWEIHLRPVTCYFGKINCKNLSGKHIHIKRGQSGVPCLSAAAQLAALSVIPPTTALASATKLPMLRSCSLLSLRLLSPTQSCSCSDCLLLTLTLLTSHSHSNFFCSLLYLFYYYRWLLSPSQTNTTTVLNNTTSPHNCCCCGYLGSVLSITAAFTTKLPLTSEQCSTMLSQP